MNTIMSHDSGQTSGEKGRPWPCSTILACLLIHMMIMGQEEAGHPAFMSPHAAPIAVGGGFVFVANTPADTLDVIGAASRAVVVRINVGIEGSLQLTADSRYTC